jgi:hypothetical protein
MVRRGFGLVFRLHILKRISKPWLRLSGLLQMAFICYDQQG